MLTLWIMDWFQCPGKFFRTVVYPVLSLERDFLCILSNCDPRNRQMVMLYEKTNCSCYCSSKTNKTLFCYSQYSVLIFVIETTPTSVRSQLYLGRHLKNINAYLVVYIHNLSCFKAPIWVMSTNVASQIYFLHKFPHSMVQESTFQQHVM